MGRARRRPGPAAGTTREVLAERREKVAEMTRAGMSAALIADVLNTTKRNVQRYRRAAGVSRPGPRPFTAEEIATIERLLDDGASLSEVARTVGRDAAVLHNNRRFKGRGWTRQQIADYAAMRRLELACG